MEETQKKKYTGQKGTQKKIHWSKGNLIYQMQEKGEGREWREFKGDI